MRNRDESATGLKRMDWSIAGNYTRRGNMVDMQEGDKQTGIQENKYTGKRCTSIE
jgi:hypothetical protein